jgi:hypothetical protein
LYAQQKNVQKSNQLWIQYYNQLKLNKKLSLMTDGGFRWKDGDRLLYIARTGIGYQINSTFRVAAGIATTGQYGTDGLNKVELRPYQELSSSVMLNKVTLLQRLRIEERYFRNVDKTIYNVDNFNFRFRYQILAIIPLIQLSAEKLYKQLSLNVSDEIFVNAGKEVVYNLLDKNRFVIGPAVQASKSLNVGLSYNFQFSQLNSAASYAHDNILWLTIRHQMNL